MVSKPEVRNLSEQAENLCLAVSNAVLMLLLMEGGINDDDTFLFFFFFCPPQRL